MLKVRYIIALLFLAFVANVSAQKDVRLHLRKGDSHYTDSIYDKAETEYRKALEKDADNSRSLYNLGNSLLYQDKAQEAMEVYEMAEKRETDKQNLAQIHHNMGVICHGSKQYAQAVEYYKQALRENPTDHETRYNLALAMKMLQNQQQNQQQDQQQDQQDKEQQQEQQQEQQEEQQQEQQQEEKEDEISQENAEQLLESAQQDEKEVQEKVKKMLQVRGRSLDKDW